MSVMSAMHMLWKFAAVCGHSTRSGHSTWSHTGKFGSCGVWHGGIAQCWAITQIITVNPQYDCTKTLCLVGAKLTALSPLLTSHAPSWKTTTAADCMRLFSQAYVQKPRLVLESLVQKAADIVKVDDVFFVPSKKNSSAPTKNHMFYTVNSNLSTCTCDATKSGQFCKHKAAAWKHTRTWMLSMPLVSSEDRRQMAVLALGERAEDVAFY